MDGMEHLWNIADFVNHFSNFLLSKKYCTDFLINLNLHHLKGSLFHSPDTHELNICFWANSNIVMHPENKPFHFQVDSTVLLS